MEEAFSIRRVRIKEIIRETEDAKTFVLECLDDWKPVYQEGQFITLVFSTRHGEKRRSYSISSSPYVQEPLSITVKKVENGEFSRLLLSHAKIGDTLFTSGIGGLFALPENIDSRNEYFFIAAGSGITPCYAMIKKILAKGKSKVVLVYSNKTKDDCIFLSALQKLLVDYPARFQLRLLFSNVLNVYQSRLSKWLLLQLLDEYLTTDERKVLFYLCGPFEYMRMISITLSARIPAENIHKENFNTLPRLISPRPPDTREHDVSLQINGMVHTLKVQYPKTILAAAKEQKIILPYSCEAGRCGSCAATCVSGKIWMAYNEVLTDDELGKGRVLVCQAYPVEGDAEIIY